MLLPLVTLLGMLGSAASGMNALTKVTLPQTFTGGSGFAMTIEPDATLGAVVDTITVGGFDHTVSSANTTDFGEDADKRLWSLETRNSDHLWGGHGQTQAFDPDGTDVSDKLPTSPLVLLGPDASRSFQAYDSTVLHGGTKSILLEWRGVLSADGDRLWVRVLVKQEGASDDGCRWTMSFGRERGSKTSVAYAVCPHFILGGPVATRGGISPYESQGRCRMLVPSFISIHAPHRAFQNVPLPAWHGYRVAGNDFEWDQVVSDHPAPSHLLQFWAMCPLDTSDAASYGKILYFQTEDTEGYQKSFRYKGLRSGTGLSAECHFRADLMQIPSFERGLGSETDTGVAVDRLRVQDEYGNSYASPYSTFVGGFSLTGHRFDFEVCQRYRTWAETAFSLVDRVSIPDRSYTLTSPFVHVVTNTFDGDNYQGSKGNLYPAIREEVNRMRSLLANPYVPVRGVVHLQAYLPEAYSVRSPGNPVALDETMPEFAEGLRGIDFRTSVYTHYLALNNPETNDLLGAWSHHHRRGHALRKLYPKYLTTLKEDELGDDRVKDWWLANIFEDVMNRGRLGALYMDVTVGNGNLVSYNYGAGRVHNGHGGNYGIRSKKKLVVETLDRLRSHGYTSQQGEIDDDAMQQTEAWEEGVSHLIDWMQGGYDIMPSITQLGEGFTLLDQYGGGAWPAISDVTSPLTGRDPNPPLAYMVYDKFYGMGRLIYPVERAALATETRIHSPINPAYDSGRAGASPQEFIDAQCYMRALAVADGCNPFSFDFHIDDYMCLMSDPNPTDDPTNAGLTVWAFIKELYQSSQNAYLGQFLFGGEIEYPLLVDLLDTGANTEQLNPLNPLDQKCGVRKKFLARTDFRNQIGSATNAYRVLPTFTQGSEVEIGLSETYFTDVQNKVVQGFQAKQIQHCVFRSPSGQLGMVLVNWSNNASAAFQADFDPTLYGIAGSYQVDRLVLGSSPVSIGSFSGTQTMHSQAAGGINLGSVGVRGLEVYTIT